MQNGRRLPRTGGFRSWRIVGAMTLLGMAGTTYAQTATVSAVPGRPALLLGAFDLAALGYRSDEFFLSGTASSYQVAATGTGAATVAGTAPFVTRFVVTRPIDPHKFNGTVIVEWDNVSGGQDVPTEWLIAHRELMRSGYVHVAVSVQKVGIDGGPAITGGGTSLKRADPARYGSLNHPGDAFAFDIFSQAGRVLRGANASVVLGALAPRHIIAAGESQSAVFLTTYINDVDPLAKVFDGFLVHSRFGGAAPLTGASLMSENAAPPRPVPFRRDLRVPVLTVLTETDVLGSRLGGYYEARVPDSKHLRVWEIAGAAHADNYLFGLGMRDSGSLSTEDLVRGFTPTTQAAGGTLDKPANTGLPHHYVVQAAIASLDRWLRTGAVPPHGAVLKVVDANPPAYERDANGLVEAGVRTPWVDVPTVRLSGSGNSGGPLAMLAGVAEPFDAATLDRLYPGGKQQFMTLFQHSLDASIQAGFILPADRGEILGVAAASYGNAQVTVAPTDAPATAQHYTTAATPLGELLDNDTTKAVLVKHVPDLVNNPQISMARGMTLKALQAYSPGLSDQTLAAIDTDLAKLPLP
jgi:hypothetical protein